MLPITESINPLSENLDQLNSSDLVQLFVDDHQQILKAIADAKEDIAAVIEIVSESLKQGGSLIYVGAGTSGRLGVLDAVECPPTFSTEPDLVKAIIAGGERAIQYAVEGAEDDEAAGYADVLAKMNLKSSENAEIGVRQQCLDVVIGISASGGAAYVIGALKAAREHGAKTAVLTNNHGAAIIKYADYSIFLDTGPEILSGSTRLKAGTSQKMVLNIISTSVMVKLGKTFGNLMIDVKVSNKKLKERAIRLVSLIAGCDKPLAEQALALSDNRVKQAILYLKKGLDFKSATDLLKINQNYLSRALA
ncbi:MAG: N-acetylmuramic acid 6-phosphate etherase [Cyanobacteria bacterium REEB446]|jgi:N-acetylmuramic acid 6-phosphate etherase|nr:N-acetylmuramic acid 6-phosphate etherase [Cyanobacteria bacterium REEB446]